MANEEKDTVTREPDEVNWWAPFLIFFFFGLLVAGVCAFLNVMVVNKLVKMRTEHNPKIKKVTVTKKKKGKKGKKGKKSKNETEGTEH